MNRGLQRRWTILDCAAVISLLWCSLAKAESPPAISAALNALNAVHPFSEVALSPNGEHLVYGSVITGKRGGADVDVSALWIVDAHDGSGAVRLTACPGSVCDEHGAAWSPDATQIAFVTTDAKEQSQIATANGLGVNVTTITNARGPLDTPRWSPGVPTPHRPVWCGARRSTPRSDPRNDACIGTTWIPRCGEP